MRLLSLDLLRFGPFTDRKVQLRADARLHVVFGPNEAGKSSAHAAVRNLLFGFPHVTAYDFVHRSTDLRIGGELRTRDGQHLQFIRRKGTKQTLLDPAGKPMADDALAPFLGNVTEDVFCRAFGLDAERLREGAMELLAADGEAGGSLMAAASGLRGLTDLRKALDEEAARIFAPRAKNRKFNEISERLKAAQEAMRGHEMRADAWKKLNAEIEACDAERQENESERAALTVQRARLTRLRTVAPHLRRIDAEMKELASLGPLPDVAADVPRRLSEAIAERHAARVHMEAQAQALDESRQALARIGVDTTLLAEAARIEELHRRLGGAADAYRDLPGVRREADDYRARLARHALDLGLEVAVLEEAPPTQKAIAGLQQLAREGATFVQQIQQTREALRKEEHLLAEGSGPADPLPLQERFAALQSLGTLIDQERKLARDIAREERTLAGDAARLYPAVPDLAILARKPLPSDDTIARLRQGFEQLEMKVSRLIDEREAAQRQEREMADRLATLAAGGVVPSPERIDEARNLRDAQFDQLRPVLAAAAPAPANVADVARFETLLREADSLADAAARDANRVAEFAAAQRTQAQARERQQVAAQHMAELLAAKQGLTQEWNALWRAITPDPTPPAEMLVWSVTLRSLLGRQAVLSERHVDLQAQRDQIAGLMPRLRQLQAACSMEADLDASQALRAIDERLRALTSAWEAARAAQARVARHKRELTELEEAQSSWTARWQQALPALHLPADTTREEALAALDVWRQVPTTLGERDNRQRRVIGMERNIDGFESDARNVVSAVGADLTDVPPREAVERLHERLVEARQQRALQTAAQKRLDVCEVAARDARMRLEQAELAVSTAMTQIGADADAETLSALFARQRIHRDALSGLRALLAESGDGHDEASLRAELESFDADAAEGERSALEARLGEVERRGQEIYARAEDARRRLREAEGRMSAEVANQQRRSAEAELQDAAHEWAVLKIAGVMLDAALKRHRSGRQDPLMQRAGALFAALTGAAYSGIDQQFGETDEVQLVARRADGSAVSVRGLSEGTRDQFYLALRLAYVEDYASRAEAAPFLADDLFASFDDRRTAHGLQVLAGLGASVQPILFTHHRHVVDLALENLGDGLDLVELA